MSTASSASPGSAVSSYRDIVAPPSSTAFDARHGGTGVSDNDLTNAIQTVPHHPHHPDQDPTNPKNLIGNNRVTPTWDGSKTTLTAFIYDLKSYFRRDNTMWHFIVSYFIPLSSGKTIIASENQAKILDGEEEPISTYTFESPAPTPPKTATPTRATTRRAPPTSPTPSAPSELDKNKYLVSLPQLASKNMELFNTIVSFITDEYLIDTYFAEFNGDGRALLQKLQADQLTNLRPDQIMKLVDDLEATSIAGIATNTRISFNAFKLRFDKIHKSIPTANKLTDTMVSERYKAAVIRKDRDVARRLASHFKVDSTDITNPHAVAESIRDFLDTEEAIDLATSPAPPAFTLAAQVKPDPRKQSRTKWTKDVGPCHHCGGTHFNKECTDNSAGTYTWYHNNKNKSINARVAAANQAHVMVPNDDADTRLALALQTALGENHPSQPQAILGHNI